MRAAFVVTGIIIVIIIIIALLLTTGHIHVHVK